MKIFETECLLDPQLPNTHVCLFISSTRVLSDSASLGSHFRENLATNSFFSYFAGIWPYFSPAKSYRKQSINFYDEIAVRLSTYQIQASYSE